MNKPLIRLGILAMAITVVVGGCGSDSDSPSRPEFELSARVSAQSACGEVEYLSQLSPTLAVWEDSIETWRGNTELLFTPPTWTNSSQVGSYLSLLVPVLEQWEDAINTSLGSAVLDTVASFGPATDREGYLTGLSALLVSWKQDLETNRGSNFLPAPPVFEPDLTAPIIACIADTTVTCVTEDGIAVAFDVTAIDDCDPAPVLTCVPPSGSFFSVGATEVTCTAIDSVGNESTCSFTVTVEAAEPPVITSVTATPSVLWPPNHKWVDVAISVETEDPCDLPVTCTIVDVTSNESANGTGDGNTDPDWMITADGGLVLRAERSGNGSGRVYTVTVRCDNGAGEAEGQVQVFVPHDRGQHGSS
jgi:HYR domain